MLISPIAMPGMPIITGHIGNSGVAVGTVRIIDPSTAGAILLGAHDILICTMTSPAYLHLMQRVAGIVTDAGGPLCHAAIIARSLGKPCIIGAKYATARLMDGQYIEVDAIHGTIKIVS